MLKALGHGRLKKLLFSIKVFGKGFAILYSCKNLKTSGTNLWILSLIARKFGQSICQLLYKAEDLCTLEG